MDNKKELRIFGIILAIILFIIGTINLYKENILISVVLYILCLFVIIFIIVNPIFLRPIHRVLLFVSHMIGWINTRLLLGLIYYLIFLPIGVVLRILRKDLLDRKFDKERGSYWFLRSEEYDSKRCERQF